MGTDPDLLEREQDPADLVDLDLGGGGTRGIRGGGRAVRAFDRSAVDGLDLDTSVKGDHLRVELLQFGLGGHDHLDGLRVGGVRVGLHDQVAGAVADHVIDLRFDDGERSRNRELAGVFRVEAAVFGVGGAGAVGAVGDVGRARRAGIVDAQLLVGVLHVDDDFGDDEGAGGVFLEGDRQDGVRAAVEGHVGLVHLDAEDALVADGLLGHLEGVGLRGEDGGREQGGGEGLGAHGVNPLRKGVPKQDYNEC